MSHTVLQSERLKKIAQKMIQPYSSALVERHKEFVNKAWPQSHKRSDPAYLTWKFRSKNQDIIENILLVYDGVNVVGQLGLIPAKVKWNNQLYEAQWGCNFKVLKELEDGGYGALLDIQSLEKKTITLGAAPSKQSEALKIRLGFTTLDGPRLVVYPIDFKYFIQLKLPSIPVSVKSILSFAIRTAYGLRFPFHSVKISSKEVENGTYREVIRMIENSRRNIALPHILHDADYLHWRCGKAPHRDEAMSLYTKAGSFILYYPTSRYCYIYESYFINARQRKLLLRQLLSIARAFPCQGLYAYANSPEEEKGFKQFGFFGFRTKLKVYAYTKDKDINLGKKIHFNVYDSDGTI